MSPISEEKKAYNRSYYERNKDRLKEAARKRYYANRERHLEAGRRWYHENRDRARERQKNWYQRNRDRLREHERAKAKVRSITQHGITLEEYDNLLNAQEGVCAICKEECGVAPRLSVDHEHSSGKIRGLLCKKCNSGLGFFRDSSELLTAAVSYLEVSRG